MLQAVELEQTSRWILHLREAIDEAAKVGHLDAGAVAFLKLCMGTASLTVVLNCQMILRTKQRLGLWRPEVKSPKLKK
eukprot:SAG31_NODE_12_length_38498_cov_21.161671_7_plen_78_part_00